MESRDKKRLIIIAIYAVIFFGVIFLVYRATRPAATCSDGIKNQNEQGIDCGGACAQACPVAAKENLLVRQTGWVESGVAGSYDIYGEVANPNVTLGSDRFDYAFRVTNAAGELVAERQGASFILPGDNKFLVETNIQSGAAPAKVELNIGNTGWVAVNSYYERPALKIVNKNYSEVSSGLGFAEATGLLKNESPFDFNSIQLRIILTGSDGKVVALNSTQMNTVQAGENRDFKVGWPNRFPGAVSNMDVQVEVNVFQSDAFYKKYFQPAQFQQLQ